MILYNGTGYFVEVDALRSISASECFNAFPGFKQHYANLLSKFNDSAQLEQSSLIDVLQMCHVATPDTMLQYDTPVVFAGDFKAVLNVDTLNPESGDAEMIEKLMHEDGYDYAITNDENLTDTLEMLTAILKKFNLISQYRTLETYWFLMPWSQK